MKRFAKLVSILLVLLLNIAVLPVRADENATIYQIGETEIFLKPGETRQMEVGKRNFDESNTLTWDVSRFAQSGSGDGERPSIDENGLLKAGDLYGFGEISAVTDTGSRVVYTLQVYSEPNSIRFNQTSYTVNIKSNPQYIRAFGDSQTSQNIPYTLTFDDPSLVEMSGRYYMRGLKTGTTTVTATYGDNLTATAEINVVDGDYADNIMVEDNSPIILTPGDTAQITGYRLVSDSDPDQTEFADEHVSFGIEYAQPQVSGESVVSVDENGTVTALGYGMAIIEVSIANGKSVYFTVNVSPEITSIRFLEDKAYSFPDSYSSFILVSDYVSFEPDNAYSNAIEFISSDPSVISMDPRSNGMASVNGAGTVTITAVSRLNPEITASHVFEVYETVTPTAMTLQEIGTDLIAGNLYLLKADYEPDNADTGMMWLTDNTNIARFYGGRMDSSYAELYVAVPGTFTVTAYSTADPTLIRTMELTASEGTLSPDIYTTEVGIIDYGSSSAYEAVSDRYYMELGGHYGVRYDLISEIAVPYRTMEEDMADLLSQAPILEQDGVPQGAAYWPEIPGKLQEHPFMLVTPVEVGSATVTMYGKTVEFIVVESLSFLEPDGITVSADSAQIETGDTVQLSASVTPDNASDKTVTWTSSDANIASVDSNGLVTGVSAGTAVITASTVNGLSAVCTVTVDMETPAGLTAKNYASTGNIKLTWNATADAYKYQVYRAASVSGTYTRIATVAEPEYLDTTGESGQTYYYKVRSMSENSVYSKFSSKKSVKCSETVLTMTAVNDTVTGKPSLTWNETADLRYYQLYRAASENGSYSKLGNVSGTSKTDNTAEAGKTYWYKVRAVDPESKVGTYSTAVSIKALPGVPGSLSVKNNPATGNIKITWGGSQDAYKYQVFRSTSSNGTYTRIATTENTQYIDTTGTSGQTYYYKVRSMTSDGVYSKYSSKKSVKCTETVLTLTAKNSTTSGKPGLGWNSAGTVKYYQLYRSTSENGTYTKIANVTGTSKSDSTAEVGKTYWYKVRAIDTDGKSGDYSESVSIVCKPARVTGVKAAAAKITGKPKLTWTAVEDAAKYQVYYSTSKTGTYKRLKEVTGTSYTHSAATAGTTYYYKVRAVSENGTYGAFSTIVSRESK